VLKQVRYAALRSYRWCRPPTCGISVMLFTSGGCTVRCFREMQVQKSRKPCRMPRHHRLGPYDDQGSAPVLPALGETHPKQAIRLTQPGSRAVTLEEGECWRRTRLSQPISRRSLGDRNRRDRERIITNMGVLARKAGDGNVNYSSEMQSWRGTASKQACLAYLRHGRTNVVWIGSVGQF
jgi:hypothetical protein